MHASHGLGGSSVDPSTANLMPSLFPPFGRLAQNTNGPGVHSPLTTVSVFVDQTDKLLGLSTADVDGLAAVLQTAWALLLRGYTGQKALNFGFERVGYGASNDIDGRISHVVLEDSLTIGELVGHSKAKLVSPVLRALPSLRQVFHTTVTLCDTTKSPVVCSAFNPVCHVKALPHCATTDACTANPDPSPSQVWRRDPQPVSGMEQFRLLYDTDARQVGSQYARRNSGECAGEPT